MILPWVSCDPDTGSADWEKARKVREAMAISIDRQKLVNNLAFGDGRPSFHQYWHGHDSRLKQQGLESLTFEYDPDRAWQLLTEAGYPDGVELDMTLTEASVAGPIAVGEAVATMWEEVGDQFYPAGNALLRVASMYCGPQLSSSSYPRQRWSSRAPESISRFSGTRAVRSALASSTPSLLISPTELCKRLTMNHDGHCRGKHQNGFTTT